MEEGSTLKQFKLVSSLLSAALLGLGFFIPNPANALSNGDNNLPVIYDHGFINTAGTCAGIRTTQQAASFAAVLKKVGYAGPVIGADYLCGDSTGWNIKNCAGPSTAEYPTNGYGSNTSIKRIALDEAWCIYKRFSQYGQWVNLAGHSMGGPIHDYAVKASGRVAGFPPYLLVKNVVTFSSPYGGLDETNGMTPSTYMALPNVCGPYTQCREMTVGSAFLKELQGMAFPDAVDWTAIGGSPKDIMTFASSGVASGGHHLINYYATTPVNYGHSAYLTDTSMSQDVPLEVTSFGQPAYRMKGGHSLYMGAQALMSANW